MKILLTGKNGQLGHSLADVLSSCGDVIAVGRDSCDLSDASSIRQLVQRVKPTIIINPAAFTAVDKAESEIEKAMAINAKAPQILGEEANKIGALVVHYSTDYVFNGHKKEPYTEDDAPDPLNIYGRSKLEGERNLKRVCPRSLIFRTSWVVGVHGGNFAKTMIRLATERESLSVVADQWGAPTTTDFLAQMTKHVLNYYNLLSEKEKNNFPFGLYHLVAGGSTNWHQYACFVINQALLKGKPIKATVDKIKAINTIDYPLPAKLPLNSCLSTHKFQQAFNVTIPHWQVGFSEVLQQILSE